jgi:tRNA threonylcarbamoyladenosine biosynthesis protein TsaE
VNFKVKCSGVTETEGLSTALGSLLKPGDIICLYGEMGTGKTTFVRGVARELGIKERITSPTFTLVKEYYNGRFPLYHLDTYRLAGPQDMNDLGYGEYFYGKGIVLIEWADRITELLPQERLDVKIFFCPPGDEDREFHFLPQGKRYDYVVEELKKRVYFRNRNSYFGNQCSLDGR